MGLAPAIPRPYRTLANQTRSNLFNLELTVQPIPPHPLPQDMFKFVHDWHSTELPSCIIKVITYEYFRIVSVYVNWASLLYLNSVTIANYLIVKRTYDATNMVYLKLKYIFIKQVKIHIHKKDGFEKKSPHSGTHRLKQCCVSSKAQTSLITGTSEKKLS